MGFTIGPPDDPTIGPEPEAVKPRTGDVLHDPRTTAVCGEGLWYIF